MCDFCRVCNKCTKVITNKQQTLTLSATCQLPVISVIVMTPRQAMEKPNNRVIDPKFYWGRAGGWMLMAEAELLSVMPQDHPDRAKVLDIFQRAAQGVVAVQSGTGLWHQLLDKPDSYLETSATAMFTFAIARGVNRGWLSPVYAPVAQTGWQALATRVTPAGQI